MEHLAPGYNFGMWNDSQWNFHAENTFYSEHDQGKETILFALFSLPEMCSCDSCCIIIAHDKF